MGPGRVDRQPRLHGQHRQTPGRVLAHCQYSQPSCCREIAARTRPDALGGRSGDRCRRARAADRGAHLRHCHHGSGARARETRLLSCPRYRPGSCERALKTWLEGRPDSWKAGIEVVGMDGIGWAPSSAAAEELPGSVPMMDPLHAHQRAQALDECRQRARRQIRGRKRGRAGDLLYGALRALLTGAALLTPHPAGPSKKACSTTRPIPGWN